MKVRKTNDAEWIRTNVRISKYVFNKAVDYNVSLSQFLEVKLREYFYMIDQNSIPTAIHPQINSCTQDTQLPIKHTTRKSSNVEGGVGLSEFESESLAPKAKRMDQATLQAPAYTV